MKPVYLDYAATTPVDARVIARMLEFLGEDAQFGNPASRSHGYGWLAEEGVETARRQVADVLHCDVREVVWTSGATESNNLAIKGAAFANRERGRHLITATSEHKAVLDCFRWLETKGFEVTWLAPQADGRVDPEALKAALRDDTTLVSLMHANNETGVINDIAVLGELCRSNGTLFHVDAAQTAGRLLLDLSQLPVDLLSLSAHKFYAPKGVGVLYVRRHPDVRIEAQMHGGGHERGLRSGTLPTHQVVGLGEALMLAAQQMNEDSLRIGALRNQLWEGIADLPGVQLNGHPTQRLPGHLNVAFSGIDGDLLITALNQIAISSGSACTSASVEPSHVLTAMGLSREHALSSLRISLGRQTTKDDVDRAIKNVCLAVHALTKR
ncbi:MAG: IscS subfamily cysteine desulfurase [Alcanivoracaceae bacterium]|nr:IscS subfamily cysteine desulfurase [Alcanivoracaceae bacterium]